MSEPENPYITKVAAHIKLQPVQTLTHAANELDTVIARLDDSHTVCTGCDRLHYNNRNERQMKVELVAVTAKLRRFAEQLYRERSGNA